VTSPTHKRSLRAALKALFTARQDEADKLRRVLDSSETTADEKLRAQHNLQVISKDTLLRMAEVVDGSEIRLQPATPILEPPVEIPPLDLHAAAESIEDPEAA